MNEQRPDRGFSLIEVLLVILIVGLLGAVVNASAGDVTPDAEQPACLAEARRLSAATDAYFAQRSMKVIPAADESPDGHEITLVDGGFLHATSTVYDLDLVGRVVVADGSPCIPPA